VSVRPVGERKGGNVIPNLAMLPSIDGNGENEMGVVVCGGGTLANKAKGRLILQVNRGPMERSGLTGYHRAGMT
jgi:hypothetical protein